MMDTPHIDDKSYSAALSYDPLRLRARTSIKFCTLNLAPSSALLDKSLGYLSIVTGTALSSALVLGFVGLAPSIALSKLLGWSSYFNSRGSSARNISTSDTGSVTALKTLSARAQMNRQGSGGPDSVAPLFVDHLSLFGPNIPGSLMLCKVFMFLARWNFYVTGRIWVDQLAQLMPLDNRIGETALLQVRTCWLDDCIETFVRENTDPKTGKADANVVILGAGYDSRCYRLGLAERGVATFEVDAPGTQAAKLRVLRDTGRPDLCPDTNDTVYVLCDFESQDWLERLGESGFRLDRPTFFVWEGVTMYISNDTVKSTLEKVATCGKGSCIGCDYFDPAWALTPLMTKVSERGGEPWLFGMKGEEPEQLVSECNTVGRASPDNAHELVVLDHLEYEELIKRYLPKHYDGRPIGFLKDFGGLLLVGSK